MVGTVTDLPHNIAVSLAVAGGGHAGHHLKDPVKMGDVGKAGLFADLGNILVRLHKFSLGVHDPGDIVILDDSAVGIVLEFPAQVVRADVELSGQLFQAELLLVMIVDIADDLAHAALLAPGVHCQLLGLEYHSVEEQVEKGVAVALLQPGGDVRLLQKGL